MPNIVKVISSIIESGVRSVKILRFGKDDIQEVRQISPHGIDSNPVKDLVALYMETGEKGKTVVVGYINKNQVAEVGETRLYGTNDQGVEQNFIHLKDDGEIDIAVVGQNSFKLKPDGTIEVLGDADFMVRFGPLQAGFNTLVSDHNILLGAYNIHVHPTAPTGPVSPPSVTAFSSTASIDASKIAEIKTS